MNKHNSIPRAEHEAREKFKGWDPILVVSPPRVFSLVILCPHFMCAGVEEKENTNQSCTIEITRLYRSSVVKWSWQTQIREVDWVSQSKAVWSASSNCSLFLAVCLLDRQGWNYPCQLPTPLWVSNNFGSLMESNYFSLGNIIFFLIPI